MLIKTRESRVLLPIPQWQWREPSLVLPRDEFGNQNCTRFVLRGWRVDGGLVYEEWFEDRDEFDFEIWRRVYEDPRVDLFWEFATVTVLTTTGGATYTSAADWDNADNTIEAIGAGGSGAAANGASFVNGTGGGGGEYRRIANFSFASPGSTTAAYSIATGGAAVTRSSSGQTNGNAGSGDTTFNSTSLVAKPGGAGSPVSFSANGGTGGTGGTGAAANFNGGRGGNAQGALIATGGGGAGGQSGAGVNGTDNSTGGGGTAGGAGNNNTSGGGTGGAGATGGGNQTATAGGSGTNLGASGSGGGGGGCLSTSSPGGSTAGNGGNYGAGGGGAVTQIPSSTSLSGAGRQGLIVLTYTPKLSGAFLMFFRS